MLAQGTVDLHAAHWPPVPSDGSVALNLPDNSTRDPNVAVWTYKAHRTPVDPHGTVVLDGRPLAPGAADVEFCPSCKGDDKDCDSSE